MSGTTTDILLTALFLLGMAIMGVALFGVALRIGPRRGFWGQPAAMLLRPGRRVFLSMYGMAILHVLVGIGVVLFVPGGEVAVLLVMVGAAVFYILCAHSWALAHTVARRSER